MTIPINPGDASGGAVRGRRDPQLVRELRGVAPMGQVTRQPAAEHPVAPPPSGIPAGLTVDQDGAIMPEDGYPLTSEQVGVLVYPGDVCRGRLTLAVDFGTGGTSYLYWEHGSIAQLGEDDEIVYARIASNIIDKIRRLADDVDAMLTERENEAQAREAQLPARN